MATATATAPAAKKRIAVTGGSGELGTLVLRRLLADRTVGEVITLDVRPPTLVSPRLRVVQADVREPDFQRHLTGCDAVVHLAFIVVGWRPRAEFDAINVEGSKNVFRAAVAAGVRQLVYTSSIAAYGVVPGHPNPILETSPRRHQPGFPYSAAKWQVEAFLDEFEPAHPSLVVTRLRPGILVGAQMEHVMGDALRRRVMPDSGDTPAQLVWDEDVADAVMLSLHKGARGAFNIAADEPLPARALAEAGGLRLLKLPRPIARGLARLSPLLARLHLGRATDPAWLDVDDATMVMSNAKAHAELGWKPRCPTARDVIKRYVETVPRRLDRRIDVFLRLLAFVGHRDELPEEARRMNARIHLAITGPDGGDVALLFRSGRLSVEREAPRPPTAIVTLSSKTFLDLLSGRSDFTTVQLTGRLRVEGEGLAGLIFQGIITMFRTRAELAGPAGWTTRQLQRWFNTDGAKA